VTAAENPTPGTDRLPGPLERRCCGAPDSGVCHQYGLCVAYGAHPATPPPVGTERDQQATVMPPVGLRPRWLSNEMRDDEITAAIGRYEAVGLDVPAEWRDELAALSSPPAPVPDTAVREQGRDADALLDTRAGLALAHQAWGEGASTMLRSVNEHSDGDLWARPSSPYLAPLMAAKRQEPAPAPEVAGPPPVPYDEHERQVLQLVDERDRLESIADDLAAAIAPAEVLGEHSSENNPWRNALDYAEGCLGPEPAPAPEVAALVEQLTNLAYDWRGVARDYRHAAPGSYDAGARNAHVQLAAELLTALGDGR